MPTGPTRRLVDPAERYFLLLGQLMPMVAVAVAELRAAVGETQARRAWQDVCANQPVARARFELAGTGLDGPAVVYDGRAVEFRVQHAEDLGSAVAAEQARPFDWSTGPLVRCTYCIDADARVGLVVTADHSMCDGRGAVLLLQDLVRQIERPGTAHHAAPPPPMHEQFAPNRQWRHDRAAMIELVRTMAAERQDRELALCERFYRGRAERELGMSLPRLSQADTAAVRSYAKAAGATVHGLLSALLLRRAHRQFTDGLDDRELALTSPVDMRRRLSPVVGDDVAGMYTTVITTSHPVTRRPVGDVARDVTTKVHKAVGRGEGELFYTLVRPDLVSLERGSAWGAEALSRAPTALAVSNMGVIDATGDPEWVESMVVGLGPTPNQIAFIGAATYRDRLNLSISVDRSRMSAEGASSLTDLATLLDDAASAGE